MLRKSMVVLAALLAVGLGQMLPVPVAVPANQGILVKPGPIPSYHSGGTGGGVDAGYILQPLNPTIYGYVGYGPYTMGFCFKPILSGNISKLGRNRGSYGSDQSTIKVWDSTAGTVIASATVTGNDWSYVDITPVMVSAGKSYFVTTYGGSYVGYGYLPTVPVNSNDITIQNGAYNTSGDLMPTTNAGTMMYGLADFYFTSVPGTETWTGAVSTDWNTNANWDGSYAPGNGIIVKVPAGLSNYPTTNSGTGYGCKTLSISSGASMTVVSGKPLACDSAIANAGTLTADASVTCGEINNEGTFTANANVTCKGGLLNYAEASFTVSPGATFDIKGDIYNAGTMENGGNINCPKNFTNAATFTSGLYSEFHLTGSADAALDAGSLDAGSGFYNLFVEKVPLDVTVGDTVGANGTYYGNVYWTFLAQRASTVDGDITSWSCYTYVSATIQARIYRAHYNGYDWGMVTHGADHSCGSGLNEFTEKLEGVQVGDKIGAYDGGPIAMGYSQGGHMLHYLGNADPGANGWYDWGYGPYALAGKIQKPAGDVTSTGDLSIGGDMMIKDGSELEVSGTGNYTVKGMWTNNGTFEPGAGTLTFDGESQIAGTAAHKFNNVTVNSTHTLYAPSYLTVTGNWACAGTFDNGGGTIEMKGGSITSGGQAFNKFIVNNASDGNVSLLDDATVANTLTLTMGNFMVGPHTLTLGTASASATAVVNGPAVFSVVGTGSTAKGTVTAAASGRPYSLTVNTEAGIAAKYANFTWMGANGIDVRSGATIDATNNFSWTSFTAGSTVGTMLKVANSQTIDNIANTSFIGTAGYNIDYAAGTGHLLVTDGGGARWGADFENDPSNHVDWATSILHDVGVTAILSPSGTVGEHMTMFPKVTVKNFGEAAENFDVRVIISNGTDAEVYNHVETVTGLAIGETRNFTFTVNSWDPTPQGAFHVLAQAELSGDRVPENDKVEQNFAVGPPYAAGWHLVSSIPPGARALKDGGWLAYDAGAVDGTGLIYASRGYKSPDFYSYDAAGNAWRSLAPWQLGTEGKMPSKGSAGCADGNGVIYATKGNNKAGFWKYTAATNAWAQLADVPLGVSNKKVKGGTSIVWAYNAGIGSPYLLKGYKNEFYQYDVVANTWRTLTPAPVGANQKWDKGSWIVSDGAHTLYAHKAKYNEFYSYNTETGVWTGPMTGMSTSTGKKPKDGSCATFTPAGTIFAFKGGNTQEFQQCTFTTDGNSWAQKETVPRGVFKKKVKAGAGMVAIGGLVFATKGNKDNSLWMYVPSSFAPEPETPQHDGVLAGKTVTAQGMSLSPNPLASGFAVLRYGLPKAGAARLSVYNMAGQTVMAQTLVAGRSGNVNLDLRHLSNGVYLVKLSSDGFENSQKLVVQR